ncbi:hypothetical protein GJ688_15465 [Heliobacillus mobilis]|uniref:HAMP domain-containing protein n=1 Tax=Heliobacterium mobile TaxID=28064 RepID=A0A6I3SMY4_HELMO|nr:adenylate/guanylate cyclase domain-containing protein [Heliobacterium mobile]MTV50368.1 hypothetical protein [Heliobacterium mobile]
MDQPTKIALLRKILLALLAGIVVTGVILFQYSNLFMKLYGIVSLKDLLDQITRSNQEKQLEYLSPLDNNVTIDDMFNVAVSKDYIYVLHNGKKQVDGIKVMQGRGQIERPMQVEAGNYIINNLTVDSSDNFYFLITRLDDRRIKVIEDQIVRYPPNGKSGEVLLSQGYDDDNLIRTGEIVSLEYYNDGVYYYRYLYDKKQIELKKLILPKLAPAEKKNGEILNVDILKFDVSPGEKIHDITGYEKGKVFYITQAGNLYRVDENGTSVWMTNMAGGERKPIPQKLRLSGDYLYFIQPNDEEIRRISITDPAVVETVFKSPAGKDNIINNFTIYEGQDDSPKSKDLIAITDKQIFRINDIDKQGNKDILQINSFYSSSDTMNKRRWIWLCLILHLSMTGIALYGAYRLYRMHSTTKKIRVPLIYKQIGVSIPVFIFAGLLSMYFLEAWYEDNIHQESKKQMMLLAYDGARQINAESLQGLSTVSDAQMTYIRKSAYEHFSKAKILQEISEEIPNNTYYASVYQVSSGESIPIFLGNTPGHSPFQKLIQRPTDGSKDLYNHPVQNFPEKKAQFGSFSNEYGKWEVAVMPIVNANQQLVGMYEVGRSYSAYENKLSETSAELIRYPLVSLLALFLAFSILSFILQKSLRQVSAQISSTNLVISGDERIDSEELKKYVIQVDSNDEVADLADSFNKMITKIYENLEDIASLNSFYHHFVPEKILMKLAKGKKIHQVGKADMDRGEKTVFISTIRNLDKFEESKQQLLNRYFTQLTPVIHGGEGVIIEYSGDGMTALFENRKDALEAAVTVCKKIHLYNDQSKEPFEFGIALHYGWVTLAILGDEHRWQGKIIEKAVTQTERLDELARTLGVTVLATESMLDKDRDKDNDEFGYRCIGKVDFQGWGLKEPLFDLFEADRDKQKAVKNETKATFEEAIRQYQAGDFQKAQELFLEVIRKNPEDKVAIRYFHGSYEKFKFIEQGGDVQDWDGVLKVEKSF